MSSDDNTKKVSVVNNPIYRKNLADLAEEIIADAKLPGGKTKNIKVVLNRIFGESVANPAEESVLATSSLDTGTKMVNVVHNPIFKERFADQYKVKGLDPWKDTIEKGIGESDSRGHNSKENIANDFGSKANSGNDCTAEKRLASSNATEVGQENTDQENPDNNKGALAVETNPEQNPVNPLTFELVAVIFLWACMMFILW